MMAWCDLCEDTVLYEEDRCVTCDELAQDLWLEKVNEL